MSRVKNTKTVKKSTKYIHFEREAGICFVMYGLVGRKRCWNGMIDGLAAEMVTAETLEGLLRLKNVH